jgi:uridine kinase
MTKWAPQRKDTIMSLAEEILHNYGKGRVIVAVDGLLGAGTAEFADDLAEALRGTGHAAFRASIDNFQRPRAERHQRGVDSPQGFYRDSFDYSVFRRVLVEPFRLGGSAAFVTAAFDAARDAPIEPKWTTGPEDAVLIVDGIFLNRPEISGVWNFSVWVDVPADLAEERQAARSGGAGVGTRYTEGQALYRAEAGPRRKAVAIIDNTDLDHPRRVFADSC